MKILLLDNYDSFTYNLFHLLEPLVERIDVVLNDQFEIEQIHQYDAVVFSPGPGLPQDAGCMPQLIRQFHQQIPMLGICLGMQAMAECFGGTLRNLESVLHGVPQKCNVVKPKDALFQNLPSSFETGHYHSWIVDQLPESFEVTAVHSDGWPMAIAHKTLNVCGVQFHPESVLTPNGGQMLKNWVIHIETIKRNSPKFPLEQL